MSAFSKQRLVRGAHARIAAEDERSGSRTGLLELIIIFAVLFAIVLRLADFSLNRGRPAPPPAAALLRLL